jgi:hypothetical protein
MVKEPELVRDGGKGSSEVMGKPDDDAVEFCEDLLVEVVRASRDEAKARLEFLNGLIANGNPAFGDVKTEEVKPFEEVGDLGLGRGEGET